VRPRQAFQVGAELPVIVATQCDAPESLAKSYSLRVHGGREHRLGRRLDGEEMTVEIGHGRIGHRIDRGEELRQRAGV
jgi:hypothetical protein